MNPNKPKDVIMFMVKYQAIKTFFFIMHYFFIGLIFGLGFMLSPRLLGYLGG